MDDEGAADTMPAVGINGKDTEDKTICRVKKENKNVDCVKTINMDEVKNFFDTKCKDK